MSTTPKPWVIFENSVFGFMEPARNPFLQNHNVSQPPRISSREELEDFIADLREAGGRVFP